MTEDRHSAEPFPRATRVLALLFLFAAALFLFHNIHSVRQLDFISFWAASELALAGNAPAAWDMAAHQAVQDGLGTFAERMPFAYPPPFLLMLLPIALLPYQAAAAAWVVLTYLAYFFTARKLLPSAGWLIAAFPPVLLNAIIGQNGFLTAALFIGGLSCLAKKPFVAGLILGCLVIKPQLALLLPIALLAGREWRGFAGAAVSSLGLLLASLLAFGPEAYAGMAGIMPYFAVLAADGLVGWEKMASVYASLRLAGLPAEPSWALHIFAALAAAAAVWLAWRGPLEPGRKAAILVAASALISPYLYVYDTAMLILPLLWLVRSGANRHLIAALWLMPLLNMLQRFGLGETINLMPLLPILMLTALCRGAFPLRALFDAKSAAKSLA